VAALVLLVRSFVVLGIIWRKSLLAIWRKAWGTGSIRAKIYSKRICPSLSPMFSVRLDVKRQSPKGGITGFVTV
jgi:hypothetical protein